MAVNKKAIPDIDRVRSLLGNHRLAVIRRLNRSRGKYSADDIQETVAFFCKKRPDYQHALRYLEDQLFTSEELKGQFHSVRWRVKDPEHLVDKLARKYMEEKKSKAKRITKDNLCTARGATDLGGIRILHLYKIQWKILHKFIMSGWGDAHCTIIEAKAYVRLGEKKAFRKFFKPKNIEISNRDYTSLHYTFRVPHYAEYQHDGTADEMPLKNVIIECQVRTVFEDGWGEIDHDVNYPHGTSAVVKQQLHILSQNTHLANDIASALQYLHGMPTFISWSTEQQLESRAVNVFCLTPDLHWPHRNIPAFIKFLRKSDVTYHFLVVPSTPSGRISVKQNREIEIRRRELKRALKHAMLQKRVLFPKVKKFGFRLPIVSDLLLLNHTYDVPGTHRDLGIMAAPLNNEPPEYEKLDVVIKDEARIKELKELFTFLAPTVQRYFV
jgi:putative GTP pyrophosphokinase